jgi:hypothetical protein
VRPPVWIILVLHAELANSVRALLVKGLNQSNFPSRHSRTCVRCAFANARTHTDKIQKMQTQILTNTYRHTAHTHTRTNAHANTNTETHVAMRSLNRLRLRSLCTVSSNFCFYCNRDNPGLTRSGGPVETEFQGPSERPLRCQVYYSKRRNSTCL